MEASKRFAIMTVLVELVFGVAEVGLGLALIVAVVGSVLVRDAANKESNDPQGALPLVLAAAALFYWTGLSI